MLEEGGGARGAFTAVVSCPRTKLSLGRAFSVYFSYRFHFIVSKQSHFSQESPLRMHKPCWKQWLPFPTRMFPTCICK